jgi:hypothetical protein
MKQQFNIEAMYTKWSTQFEANCDTCEAVGMIRIDVLLPDIGESDHPPNRCILV